MNLHKLSRAMIPAITFIAMVSGPALAQSDQMHAVASETGKTIFYTTCSVDEFSECIDYMFGCEKAANAGASGELSLMISGFEEEECDMEPCLYACDDCGRNNGTHDPEVEH